MGNKNTSVLDNTSVYRKKEVRPEVSETAKTL
jgi:hypothetical protein